MNGPFDPQETHDGSENEDLSDQNSATWGAADPDFDQLLRGRIGPVEPLATPAYAFERVLLAGRRRRARKVWAVGSAAALVVMIGTAGTTVALQGGSVQGRGPLPPAAAGTQGTTMLSAAPTSSASASPSGAASSASPSAAGTTSPGAPSSSAVQASVPACHSDDLQLTVSLQPGPGDQDSLLIVLRNNSGHTCTTFGYPGLQTETVGQQLQTTTVSRQDQSAVRTLTLGQGASVSTLAAFTTTPATATASPTPSPVAGCGAPSYYLAVIPPDQQTQIVEPITGGPVAVCGNGVLSTGPFTSGQTG